MKRILLLTIVVYGVFWGSCTNKEKEENTAYIEYVSNYDALPDNEATKLLKKAIEFCGGWEAYTRIEGIDYRKTLIKIDSTGMVTDTIVQQHQYNVFPSFKINMLWNEGDDEYEIRNNGNQSWKLKNGRLMTDQTNINSAYNSSHGSQYVLFQPWKLADTKVQLEYTGLEALPNGREGLGLKVNYTKGYSTTTDHTWWYYFDKDSGAQVATFLKHATGYSYTEFVEFTKVDGLTFHSRRNSYKSDKTREELELRTIYINELIKLTPTFSEKLFTYNDK